MWQVGIYEEAVQPYTAKAVKDSELYWISKEDLQACLEGWPEARADLVMAARTKVDGIIVFRSVLVHSVGKR
jgi:hypothetical protein